MLISYSVSLIWLFAMLAATVHLGDCKPGLRSAVGTVLAFVSIYAAALWFSPQPNWIGVLIGLGAFWRLIAGPLPRAGMVLAGASAGLAASLQIAGGISPWLVLPVTAVALALAFLLGRPRTEQGSLREKALILVASAAPLVGLASDMIFGWQSATMLSRDAVAAATVETPGWTIAIVAVAVVAGLAKGIWIKR